MGQEKTVGAREARREEWRRIMAQQQGCGQSAAAYCRERGIPVWKFSYWRKALTARDGTATPGGFVELRPARRASGVCVESGRWRVRVEPGFDAATLLRALEALAALAAS
jgi:hypothetical protein